MTEYMFASLSARNTNPAAELGSKRMFAETTAALQEWFWRKSVVGVITTGVACQILSFAGVRHVLTRLHRFRC